MKTLIIILVLFCLQEPDTTKVMKPVKLFFAQNIEQRAEDINIKLDSLLIRLETKNDTLK